MIGRLKKLLKTNKALSLISSGTAAILGLLTFGLLARSFSMTELGYWGFFLTVYTMFDMLRAGLVSNAMIKKINEFDTEEEVARVIGSAWNLSLKITLIGSISISVLFYIIYLIKGDESYKFLFQWFVPIALVSLPHSMATWIFNAYVKFGKIVWIRFFLQFGFLLGVIYQFYFQMGLDFVLAVYFLSNLLPGLISSVKGWNKLKYVRKGTIEMNKSLFSFGKYSMGSMIGSNFLRSSDTYLILGFLGPNAVAFYNVPEKLVGLIDIPLRAFVSIAFPQLAKKYSIGLRDEFKDEFETGSGFSTLLLLPISILAFIFAEPLVIALGGQGYADSANILRIFTIYTALTPLDRFSGIALDVINRPDLNFKKVLLMLSANVIGDVLVLHYTGDMLWVAFVSIVTFTTGIIFGFIFLKNELPFRPLVMLQKGTGEYVRLVKKYLSNSR